MYTALFLCMRSNSPNYATHTCLSMCTISQHLKAYNYMAHFLTSTRHCNITAVQRI